MSKTSIIIIVAVLILIGGALIVFNQSQTTSTVTTSSTNPTPTTTSQKVNITASFEIYTNSTKRIFTDSKYHQRSPEVYIEASDPSVVHVIQADITWADFFATLPMKLTTDCLTTGTSQTFCTNDAGQLMFFLNSTEDPNALNLVINQDDQLVVKYVAN